MLPALATCALAGLAWTGSLEAQIPDSSRVAPPAVVDSLADTLAVTDSLALPVPLPQAAVTHLRHLTDTYSDTPGGTGLILAGVAEAAIASQYVVIAGTDSTYLAGMTRQMSNVIHAIDPSQASGGPGMGYGVKRAADGVRQHAALAAAVPGVSPGLLFHLGYVDRAAAGARARAEEAIGLARRVQQAQDAPTAHRLLKQLAQSVRAMAYGDDRDRDGRIGFADNEVGLAQAMYHLQLLYRVEGLAPAPPLR